MGRNKYGSHWSYRPMDGSCRVMGPYGWVHHGSYVGHRGHFGQTTDCRNCDCRKYDPAPIKTAYQLVCGRSVSPCLSKCWASCYHVVAPVGIMLTRPYTGAATMSNFGGWLSTPFAAPPLSRSGVLGCHPGWTNMHCNAFWHIKNPSSNFSFPY